MAKKKPKTTTQSKSDGGSCDSPQPAPPPPRIDKLVRLWITPDEDKHIHHQASGGCSCDARQLTPPPARIDSLVRLWITSEEAKHIYRQISKSCIRNKQVLWSGMLRQDAQKWADAHNLQTLTTALGPLLNTSHPDCPYKGMPCSGWKRYMHGASVIFAWYISQGDLVTVLSQPPPQRFHPSGETYYQTIEEPIVKGLLGNKCVKRMIAVHPTVGKATEFKYEMWPHDELSTWTNAFGIQNIVVRWRPTSTNKKTVPNTQAEPASTSSQAEQAISQAIRRREKRRRYRQRKQAKKMENMKSGMSESNCKQQENKASGSVTETKATKKKGQKAKGGWS